MANSHELAAMRRAIAISAQGLGSTSPNPPVGCVILDSEGRSVSEGYHVRKGEPHAEVNALTAAGDLARGGTAVVTLEPCNHYGRTPPCREALINAHVNRVLIAVMDPTSRGEGGASMLRDSGVDVEIGVLKEEALLVLGPWLASILAGRPFITWVYEADSDGSPVSHSEHGTVLENIRSLHDSHDFVLDQNMAIAEGRPRSHGEEVFQMPHQPLSLNPREAIEALRAAGARSVLIEGISDEALSIVTSVPADQVIAYLPCTSSSRTPEETAAHLTALPDGYRINEVSRVGNYVRLVGRRT